MRLVIDLQGAQTIGSRHRGIGRYSLSLVRAMARNVGPDIDLRIALNGAFPDRVEELRAELAGVLPASAFSVYRVPLGTYPPPVEGDPAQGLAGEIVRLHYASLEPDAVLQTSVFEGFGALDVAPVAPDLPGVLSCAILYDLIPLVLPDRFLTAPTYRAHYQRQLGTLERTDLLLAISDATRRDALDRLGRGPQSIATIRGAVEETLRDAPRAPRAPELPSEPYVLVAGGQDPNKNLAAAFDAFARLPKALRQRFRLVHIGTLHHSERDLAAEFARPVIETGGASPIFLGHVSDGLLVNAYDHASLFVFPSLYEGFGLPPLEAMTRGTPTIACHASSMTEVVAPPDALVEPGSVEALATAMERALSDDVLLSQWAAAASKRASQFSWDAVAADTLGAIRAARNRPDGCAREPMRHDVHGAIRSSAVHVASGAATPGQTIDLLIDAGRLGAETGPARCLVDVSETDRINAKTGIQRVVRRTSTELQRVGADSDRVAGTWARSVVPISFHTDPPQPVQQFVAASTAANTCAIRYRTADTLLMLDSSWALYPSLGQQFAAVRACRGRVVTAIYDLVPLLHPDLVADGMATAFETWFRRALLESDGLVCISRAVADEVIAFVRKHDLPHRDGLRIGWWHLGSDIPPPPDAKPNDALTAFLDTDASVFLMVGTIEPRKRHAVALDAMERLWAEGRDARLALLGKEGWRVEDFAQRLRKHPKNGHRLLWLDKASDGDIAAAYARSTALVFASVYEGYGLPVVEAARAGLGSVAADIPVLREVGGDGALYFAVDDPAALADALRDVADERRRPDPSRTIALSWRESAEQLYQVLFADRWYAMLRPGEVRYSFSDS